MATFADAHLSLTAGTIVTYTGDAPTEPLSARAAVAHVKGTALSVIFPSTEPAVDPSRLVVFNLLTGAGTEMACPAATDGMRYVGISNSETQRIIHLVKHGDSPSQAVLLQGASDDVETRALPAHDKVEISPCGTYQTTHAGQHFSALPGKVSLCTLDAPDTPLFTCDNAVDASWISDDLFATLTYVSTTERTLTIFSPTSNEVVLTCSVPPYFSWKRAQYLPDSNTVICTELEMNPRPAVDEEFTSSVIPLDPALNRVAFIVESTTPEKRDCTCMVFKLESGKLVLESEWSVGKLTSHEKRDARLVQMASGRWILITLNPNPATNGITAKVARLPVPSGSATFQTHEMAVMHDNTSMYSPYTTKRVDDKTVALFAQRSVMGFDWMVIADREGED